MGYPADGFEGKYRNHKDEVCSYLKKKHFLSTSGHDGRLTKVKIYNLCIEKNK